MSEENYKKFVEYFKELDDMGIPYGLSDLFRMSRELGLPPCKETVDWIKGMNKKCR